MKTKTLLLLLLFTTNLFSQIVNIPDLNFKYRLLNHTWFGGDEIDTNNNDEIEVSEAEAITELIVGDPNATQDQINDMTGIGAFINITSLNCMVNQIVILDLSQNTKLEYIHCGTNNITLLNISQCSQLKFLYCIQNELTQLDISQNLILEDISCYQNNIQSLNTTNNTMLKILKCYQNQITSIDTSNNTVLEILFCGENQFSSINVNNNLLLKYFSCNDNNITVLDVSGNNILTRLSCHDNLLNFLNVQNGNNTNFSYFNSLNNSDLICVFVDNMTYSTDNWTNIDPNSHFVETQTECDAVGVNEELLDNITIYPNPTNGIINFEYSEQLTEYQLLDTLGREIYKSQKPNIKSQIDLSYLSQGIYYLKIKTNNNQTLTHKIIKQ